MRLGYILAPIFVLFTAQTLFAGASYEELEKQLKSRNPRERERAVRELTSRAAETRALSLLKNMVKDSDTEVRAQATFGLGRSGKKEALSAILEGLTDKQLRVRKTAVTSAFQVDEAGAVKPVLRRLARETDPSMKSQILSAVLGSNARRIATRKETRLLEPALADRSAGIRRQAVSVLVAVGNPKEVVSTLTKRIRFEKDTEILRHIIAQAAEIRDASATKIVESVIQKGSNRIRHAGFDALEKQASSYPEETARILSRFMSNSDETVQTMAIKSARKCSSSIITKKLMRLTEKDGTLFVRTSAINSLGFHAKDSRKIVSFLERFGNAPQAGIRYAAIQALVGKSKNVRFFQKLLNGRDPEIRAAAVQGLIQMQTKSSGKVFISMLRSNSDPSMRILAARALGKYGWERSCRKALSVAAKKDRNKTVRVEAKKILDSL